MSYIFYPSPTPVFPVLSPLTWPRNKKPKMSSTVTTAMSGREIQLARAVYPRWEFSLVYGGDSWLRDQTQNIVPYGPLSGKTEYEQLCGLFLACNGSYGEFYYDDPDDDSRSGQFVALADGVTTDYPLYYSWGTGPFNPSLTLPVSGVNTIDAVYFNGNVVSPSTYAIDATGTGIQFTTAPPKNVASVQNTITADFHFYYRCRFNDDTQSYEEWALNLWQNKKVMFTSVKP